MKKAVKTAFGKSGADDGIRTRDPNLGKVMLYQLSHVRNMLEATPGFEPGIKALQASALPLGHVADKKTGRKVINRELINGADDGIRTRDPNLGKVMLYQLSHVRTQGFIIRV